MVTAGMTPRDAVRQLEARLTAAGCPDADYDAAELFRLVTGRDVRLADAPLTEAQAARLEYSAERLRVLYVGITRARRELVITWNTGRNGDCTEAVAVRALREIWEGSKNA